jgi:carboxyl-terminal processing protease
MDIKNLVSDTSAINTDKDKIDKNKQWIKVRSDDIYIDETVKVLNKIISQNNTAKTN